MKTKNLLGKLLLIISVSVVVAAGCSSQHIRKIDLSDLLIKKEDMPPGWPLYEFSDVGVETYRSRDSVSISFNSDLYPDSFNCLQSVYRFKSASRAERDYENEVDYYKKYHYVPSHWTFASNEASESYVSCKDNNFPTCVWIARYNNIVIEFRASLVPKRFSLNDMEVMVKEIDLRAREFIINVQ